MLNALTDNSDLPPVAPLLRDSTEPLNPWRDINALSRPEPLTLPAFEHAEPLTSLRDRDLTELATWFERPDMMEIEEDVNHHLLMLFPEPCWDDEDSEHFFALL
jgi:hypothetical protein